MTGVAIQATHRVVAALPETPGVYPFHAEFFDTVKGLVLCEIACRTGGGCIREIYRRSFGYDLVTSSLGLQVTGGTPRFVDNGARYGFAIFPPPHGCLAAAPETSPVPGTVRYEFTGEVGRHYEGAHASSDAIAELVFEVPHGVDAIARMRTIARWWNDSVHWDRESQMADEQG
jgi:hypothetical protein